LIDWLGSQLRFVGEGLGPASLAVLLASPFLARDSRRRLVTLALLAAPGLVMVLVFRQGSFKHAFWGFNLMLPAAFAMALLVTRLPRAGVLLVAAQAALCIAVASERLLEEREQNALGALAARLPRGAEVPVVARGAFHPYVSWYARGVPVTVRKREELPAGDGPALVDTAHLASLGCGRALEPRWQIMARSEIRAVCAAPALLTSE
jgi:hypothetical protein